MPLIRALPLLLRYYAAIITLLIDACEAIAAIRSLSRRYFAEYAADVMYVVYAAAIATMLPLPDATPSPLAMPLPPPRLLRYATFRCYYADIFASFHAIDYAATLFLRR